MKHAIGAILLSIFLLGILGAANLSRPDEICGVVVAAPREVSVWHAPDCPEWTPVQGGAEIDTSAVTFWRGRIPPVCQAVAVLRKEGDPIPRVVPLMCDSKRTDGNGPRG